MNSQFTLSHQQVLVAYTHQGIPKELRYLQLLPTGPRKVSAFGGRWTTLPSQATPLPYWEAMLWLEESSRQLKFPKLLTLISLDNTMKGAH